MNISKKEMFFFDNPNKKKGLCAPFSPQFFSQNIIDTNFLKSNRFQFDEPEEKRLVVDGLDLFRTFHLKNTSEKRSFHLMCFSPDKKRIYTVWTGRETDHLMSYDVETRLWHVEKSPIFKEYMFKGCFVSDEEIFVSGCAYMGEEKILTYQNGYLRFDDDGWVFRKQEIPSSSDSTSFTIGSTEAKSRGGLLLTLGSSVYSVDDHGRVSICKDVGCGSDVDLLRIANVTYQKQETFAYWTPENPNVRIHLPLSEDILMGSGRRSNSFYTLKVFQLGDFFITVESEKDTRFVFFCLWVVSDLSLPIKTCFYSQNKFEEYFFDERKKMFFVVDKRTMDVEHMSFDAMFFQ